VPGIRGVLIAIPAGVVMLAGLAAIYYVLFPALHLSEGQQMNQLIATPFWWRFISVIRAAVGEEVLFRGYAIERLQELTGSRTVAAVLSCAVFSLAHVGPWGWSHLLIAGFGGVMLTALYLWRRNLWVNIIAHFIVDGVAVLLA
jgi:membrane protease YdiL (CAAX protease family)